MRKGERELLERIEKDIREVFQGEGSGHDHLHILRVRDNALHILSEEGEAEPFLVEGAALLHDLGDSKFFDGDEEKGNTKVKEWLSSYPLEPDTQKELFEIIQNVSFRSEKDPDASLSLETRIVQDADRLDALGAIGIARAFAFGGRHERPIHLPVEEKDGTKGPTIDHFHEKLLLLKDRMKTRSGYRLAEGRHRFMEGFLDRFHQELNREC